MSQDKGGASSTRLASDLKMHQATVWCIMHKIRHAMGRRDELISLAGFIEMDEAIIGPHARRPTDINEESLEIVSVKNKSKTAKTPKQRGRGRPKKSGTNKKKQTPVLVLVEQGLHHASVVAMQALEAQNRENILEFVQKRVDESQHIKTDGWSAHHVLRSFNCTYEAVVCSGPQGCIELPVVHRAITLLKIFLMGTYFGVAPKHLQAYLNEFCFRFNRKDTHRPLWLSALSACIFTLPITCAELIL